MPRIGRIVILGVPHHVTQRGNNAQDIFFADDDRAFYVATLEAQSARFGLALEGYCLMTNHVHIVGTPKGDDSLALAVGRTNFIYALYVNRLHGRTGHLWQNRFYSCALDDERFFHALRYVETNPVRARIVRAPWRYDWSSARHHCGEPRAKGTLDLARWKKSFDAPQWKVFLAAGGSDEEDGLLRRNTHTGRPLGTDSFVSKIEAEIGRRLRALPVGRPRKVKKK
jgi:putative transposase